MNIVGCPKPSQRGKLPITELAIPATLVLFALAISQQMFTKIKLTVVVSTRLGCTFPWLSPHPAFSGSSAKRHTPHKCQEVSWLKVFRGAVSFLFSLGDHFRQVLCCHGKFSWRSVLLHMPAQGQDQTLQFQQTSLTCFWTWMWWKCSSQEIHPRVLLPWGWKAFPKSNLPCWSLWLPKLSATDTEKTSFPSFIQ